MHGRKSVTLTQLMGNFRANDSGRAFSTVDLIPENKEQSAL
jgi:hypothetical protein